MQQQRVHGVAQLVSGYGKELVPRLKRLLQLGYSGTEARFTVHQGCPGRAGLRSNPNPREVKEKAMPHPGTGAKGILHNFFRAAIKVAQGGSGAWCLRNGAGTTAVRTD